MPVPETLANEIEWQAVQAQRLAAPVVHASWLNRLTQQIVKLTLTAVEPHLKPARLVVRSIEHLTALPHGTILMTSAQSVAQIQDDEDGHYLRYMATEEADSLEPTDLFWNKMSRHTLTMCLPAVIIQP